MNCQCLGYSTRSASDNLTGYPNYRATEKFKPLSFSKPGKCHATFLTTKTIYTLYRLLPLLLTNMTINGYQFILPISVSTRLYIFAIWFNTIFLIIRFLHHLVRFHEISQISKELCYTYIGSFYN